MEKNKTSTKKQNKENYFYMSSGLYEDERIKNIDKAERDFIFFLWISLVLCAVKNNERISLKNCLDCVIKGKNLLKKNTTKEQIIAAVKRLEELNLLDINAIKNIVKFEE